MKKRTFLALFMCVALLFITACGTNEEEPEDVPEDRVDQSEDSDEDSLEPSVVNNFSMETEESTYPSETDQLSVFITNNTDEDAYYGVEFRVDRRVDGEWEEVPFEEEMSFIQIAIDLPAGEQTEETIDLTLFEDYLEPGDYRIVKQVNGQEVYAPFSIE
ncbi:hypothetical protein GCM10008932_23550 [Alkalibacterium iburiense]|uniref:Bacterial Ig-like domain-containing protein n=1 Tax=Alkalibacterium iburiense TaxID=290589 RepID=A0ABN0XSC6_9LACT